MSRRGLLGVAAAACVACCAGPFLAAAGGIAVLGAAGSVAFGVSAIAVAGFAIAVLTMARRRHRGEVRSEAEPAPVELGPPHR